jgi:TRAP-type C4-dicarboxylate transport system substrate-binding protein
MASSTVRGIAAALVAAISMAGLSSGAVAENWKCYTYQAAPASPVNIGLKKMADFIGEATKGRISVKCSVGGALPIDANSIGPAVSDGVIDFGSVVNISGFAPLVALGSLPGLFTSNAEYDTKGWPVLKSLVLSEFDKRGVKVLGFYHYPSQVVFGAKGAPPLKALADLKGKTLRIGNPEQGELAKAIGAIPVTLPTPDVAPALQRGTVQYVVTAAAAGGRLWRDFFASGIMDQIFVTTSFVVVNKKRWEALSKDEQAAIEKNASETSFWITKSQEDDDSVALKEFIEKDKWTIVPKSATVQAEIVKVMQPIWKRWAEERGPEAVKSLAELNKVLGRPM